MPGSRINSRCQDGGKSLAPTYVSGCVKGQNQYENLTVEEIVNNKDSMVTNPISNSPSEVPQWAWQGC